MIAVGTGENAMNSRCSILAVCFGALVFCAGCNKPETTSVPPAAPQAQSAKEAQSPPATPSSSPPSTPTAPMPPPNAPDTSSGPKAGQANDHSSPAFKQGKDVSK
jgi:hypothetical protein